MEKAVKVTLEKAEVASSEGIGYCIVHVNVGSDTAAIREAVVKVSEEKVGTLKLSFNIFEFS